MSDNDKRKIEIKGGSVKFTKGGVLLRGFPEMFRYTIKQFDEIPCERHTLVLEQEGARLVKSGFADKKAISCFLDNVFGWGGKTGDRVRGLIDTRYKSRDAVVRAIPKAVKYLQSGNMKEAIEKMIEPKGLSVSYGSKILRMLLPQTVVVYDSILAVEFGESDPSIRGWVNLCRDCQDVAKELNRRGKNNPLRKNGEWYAADVEAVVFQRIREG